MESIRGGEVGVGVRQGREVYELRGSRRAK